ncbi:MAG: aspartate dehydrogenase [Candidatus Hodarchaeaceae archaeon]|nr:aspartate dehydrogenase [Candidatus Hodarchaeaceae archaeon]
MRLNVALVGCGAIGSVLARAIDEGRAGDVKLGWVYDLKREKSKALVKKLRLKPRIAKGASEIYADKTVGLVIEAASQQAVEQYSLDIIRSGKDLMVMSVGAFANDKLLKNVRAAAERNGRRVYIPSGAVLGIDGVKAAGLGRIREAVLTTRKPPATLAYSEYLQKRRIRLKGLKRPRVVFDGSAREAVKAFPASVNVAATLSLAGIGLDRTRVRIVADPKLRRNVHEIRVRGEAGELITEARNVPFPDVRRTSYLAALSAIRTLRNLSETIRVGT